MLKNVTTIVFEVLKGVVLLNDVNLGTRFFFFSKKSGILTTFAFEYKVICFIYHSTFFFSPFASSLYSNNTDICQYAASYTIH